MTRGDVEVVSFDLFGTLVTVSNPDNPAAAVAEELKAHGVSVPDDWERAYCEPHLDHPHGVETPLPEHIAAALSSRREVNPSAFRPAADRAVRAAFDPDVRTRSDATRAVMAASEQLPVAVLSNCSVPGLAERALAESEIEADRFDAVVTSVGCGWRKPDPHAFETVAGELSVDPAALLHIGDDPDTDGSAEAAGAASLLIGETPLAELAERWE